MPQASCAVCERPFGAGERFAIWGSYVVHQYCAGQIPAQERYLADIRRKVSNLDYAMERERADAKQVLAEVQEELRRARLERTVAESQMQMAVRGKHHWESLASERLVRIQGLEQEVTRHRNLPVATAPAPVPATPASEQISAPEDDQKDGTAIRFGLLELD